MKYESGEVIPIRLFLGGFELTPTFREVNKKFSVRYYLNLVLIDEENRRYFKQQEITIFRIPDVREQSLSHAHLADFVAAGISYLIFFLVCVDTCSALYS